MERIVSLTVHLFGKPEWEFDKINPKTVRAKADELKERLQQVADVMEKLSKKKWSYEFTSYDIIFDKNIAKKEAEKELKGLGIKKEVYEFEEDEQ